MIVETSHLSQIGGLDAEKPVHVPERDTLRNLLDRLHEVVADQSRALDADRDRDFIYFDVPLDLDLDAIDLCVHEGRVLIRMLREE